MPIGLKSETFVSKKMADLDKATIPEKKGQLQMKSIVLL